jgi:hypothetical protein
VSEAVWIARRRCLSLLSSPATADALLLSPVVSTVSATRMDCAVQEAETGYEPAAPSIATPRRSHVLQAGRHRRQSTCPAAACLPTATASLAAAAAPVLSPCAAPDVTVSLLEVDALSLQPTLAAALTPSSAAALAQHQQAQLQPLPSLPAVSNSERRRRKQSRTLSEVSALQPQPAVESTPRMSDAMLGAISGSLQPQQPQPDPSCSSPQSRAHRQLLAPLAAGGGAAGGSSSSSSNSALPRRSATLTAASLLPALRER